MKVIANKENLNVTDDEYKDGLSTYFKSQGQGYPDEATFEQSVGKQSIMEVLLADKVVKFLMDNGKAVEKKESSTTSGSAASSSK
jgi:FKBP-type peptidyl-prolyl cis-trans isomerase (trigger factor)